MSKAKAIADTLEAKVAEGPATVDVQPEVHRIVTCLFVNQSDTNIDENLNGEWHAIFIDWQHTKTYGPVALKENGRPLTGYVGLDKLALLCRVLWQSGVVQTMAAQPLDVFSTNVKFMSSQIWND